MKNSLLEGFEEYRQNYEPDEYLFKEGDHGDSFYIIQEGLVEVLKEDDEVSFITSLGPGELVGEMALLGEESDRSAAVKARIDTVCLRLGEKQFDNLLKKSHKFRRKILEVLSRRVRVTTEDLACLKSTQNLLYDAALLLLHFLEEEKWRGHRNICKTLNPDVAGLSKGMKMSGEKLENLLATPRSKDLQVRPPKMAEELQATAREILTAGLVEIKFKSPHESEYHDYDYAVDYSDLKAAAGAAKKLYTHLKSIIKEGIPRDRLSKIRSEYDRLKVRHSQASDDPHSNLKARRQLGAHVRGLQRVLSNIKPSQVEPADPADI